MALGLDKIGTRKKTKKRVGRGNASGHGTYSCRGLKGQRSRSGGKGGLKLKGFKKNLLNIPKMKGMKSKRPKNQLVNISSLEKFSAEEKVTPGSLFEKGLIDTMNLPVKILTDKKNKPMTKKVEIYNCFVSDSAKKLIEAAGGKIIDLETRENKSEKV